MLNRFIRSIRLRLSQRSFDAWRAPPPSERRAQQNEPVDVIVLLAWATVGIPIVWGFFATLRDALGLLP